jgi:hypothetical protein
MMQREDWDLSLASLCVGDVDGGVQNVQSGHLKNFHAMAPIFVLESTANRLDERQDRLSKGRRWVSQTGTLILGLCDHCRHITVVSFVALCQRRICYVATSSGAPRSCNIFPRCLFQLSQSLRNLSAQG